MMKRLLASLIIILSISAACIRSQDACATSTGADCSTCLSTANATCSYCKDTKSCQKQSTQQPCSSPSQLQFQTCIADAQTLLIVLGSLGGVLLLAIIIGIVCIYCKCQKRKRSKDNKEHMRNERQLEDRRAAAEVRSAERNAKNDAIRMKYGLMPGTDAVEYRRMS